MLMHWHKLDEVENKSTLHNFIVLTIFMPKIIKVGENLTKLWEKQFWVLFETQCIVDLGYSDSWL